MQLTDKHRDEIGRKAIIVGADALKKGQLTIAEFRTICRSLLDNLLSCSTQEKLIAYLKSLYIKWPVFSHLLTIEKGVLQDIEEDEKVKHLEKLIKSKKIDQALKVARSPLTSRS